VDELFDVKGADKHGFSHLISLVSPFLVSEMMQFSIDLIVALSSVRTRNPMIHLL